MVARGQCRTWVAEAAVLDGSYGREGAEGGKSGLSLHILPHPPQEHLISRGCRSGGSGMREAPGFPDPGPVLKVPGGDSLDQVCAVCAGL